jgi:hypothetical protein
MVAGRSSGSGRLATGDRHPNEGGNTMQTTLAAPTARLEIARPTDWTDRSLATASWWDQYTLLPGSYPFEWINLSGTPWNPDPDVHTSGFIANTGPYYGRVRIDALLTAEYREARLLQHMSSELKQHHMPKQTVLSQTVYAYQLPGCPKGQHGTPLTNFLGGVVVQIGA